MTVSAMLTQPTVPRNRVVGWYCTATTNIPDMTTAANAVTA